MLITKNDITHQHIA